jgi:hypothetical protein
MAGEVYTENHGKTLDSRPRVTYGSKRPIILLFHTVQNLSDAS